MNAGSKRIDIGLAGADAHDVLDRKDEDLAVADLSGLCRGSDCLDGLVGHVGCNGDFQFQFRKEGNGIFQTYHKNGKIRLIGRVKNGKREGKFEFKADDGTKIMDIVFLKDSAIQTQCLSTDSVELLEGECVFERLPEFPGGVKGWSRYLALNLKYPESAINRNIQGVVLVQFIVFKDGKIDSLKIISSPDESLSEEVLRLMKNCPLWKPAIQYNKPMLYRHVQGVSFTLLD